MKCLLKGNGKYVCQFSGLLSWSVQIQASQAHILIIRNIFDIFNSHESHDMNYSKSVFQIERCNNEYKVS